MKKLGLILMMVFVPLLMMAADTYTIAGVQALMGSNWDPTDTNNDMSLQNDGTYVLVKQNVELAVGGYDYKAVGDHTWDGWQLPSSGNGNQTLAITEQGKYNITFTLDVSVPKLEAKAVKVGDAIVEYDYYTVVGDQTLMGVDWGQVWSQTEVNNDMAKQDDGSYVLKKESVVLSVGTYQYKVSANHDWGIWELPSSGNQTLAILEDGKYNVTFKLTLGDNPELTAEATKVGDIVIDHTYTIAGVQALMGSNWDPTDTYNDMSLKDDGTYVLVKQNVELEVNTNPGYGYKAVRDHSWDWSIPQDDANQYLLISTHGMYDVKFTLTLGDNPTLVAEAVLKQEILPDYILHYGVSEQQWQDKVFVAGEGEYEGKLIAKEVEFAENTEFGIKYGDTWYAGLVTEGSNYLLEYGHCTNIPLDSEGNIKNFHINQAGTYTFILTVGEDGITMDVEGLQAPPAPDYILHYGNDNVEWQNATFVAGEGEYAGKLLAKEVVFAADTEFEINYGNICYGGLPNGEEPHYWIHYGWCENIPLSTGEGIKHFIINEAGTYSFILTIGEDGITMDVLGFPVRGDVTGDGKVDTSDLNAVINIILSKASQADYPGNANIVETEGDDPGKVDVSDLNAIVNIILGKSIE